MSITNAVIAGGTITLFSNSSDVETSGAYNLLRDNAVVGAFHNSAERRNAPRCHPGTRKPILKAILHWTKSDIHTNPILWLYGPAGSGKSSIAQTMAEMLYEEGRLAASVFFARTAISRSNSGLVATIAYQLLVSIPEVKDHVLEAVISDRSLFSKSLKAQFEALLAQPLEKLSKRIVPTKRIIIIDGLDECGGSEYQQHVLQDFFSTVQRLCPPLLFLITSRPEYTIRNFFRRDQVKSLVRRLVLDEENKPDEDIKTFLLARFDDIRRDHPSGPRLPSYWPSPRDIDQLVRKACGQFIYASEVMTFIASPDHRPRKRLDIVLGPNKKGEFLKLFPKLDASYADIFQSVKDIERVKDIIAFLLLDELNIGAELDKIEDFLLFERGDLEILLKDLHSIIHVPVSSQGLGTLHIFYTSLGEFLMDDARAGRLSIVTNERMIRYFLEHLAVSPQDNELAMASFDDEPNPHLRYMPHFDCFLKARLSQYPPPTSFHLFTASTLKDFDRHSEGIFHVLTLTAYQPQSDESYTALDSKSYMEVDSRGCIFQSITKDCDYQRLVTKFFRDKDRSGIYHVSMTRYRNLAFLFIGILKYSVLLAAIGRKISMEEVKMIEECSLDLLLATFSVIPEDHELAQYLRSNPILTQTKFISTQRKNEAQLAIKSYIEECNKHIVNPEVLQPKPRSRMRSWFRRMLTR